MSVTTVSRPTKRRRKSAPAKQESHIGSDMLVKLHELLQGERDSVRLFSKALDSEICFINTAALAEEYASLDCPVYTTRELSFVLSLSADEFQRYHYLKMKLA